MLWSSLMIAVGSFMPWVATGFGNISGATGMGAGYWTFIAAMLGVSGALMPWRRVATVHAAIVSVVAVALPVWQVLHLYTLVGFGGWMPGIGLVLVLFGGLRSDGVGNRTMSQYQQHTNRSESANRSSRHFLNLHA